MTRRRQSPATDQGRRLGPKPTRQLVWRTASYHRAHELLREAEAAAGARDQLRLHAAMDRLRALPGFPRDMQPTDHLIIEQIAPIISLGTPTD